MELRRVAASPKCSAPGRKTCSGAWTSSATSTTTGGRVEGLATTGLFSAERSQTRRKEAS